MIPGERPFKFDKKYVAHVRDDGMMQLLANGLKALGWEAKIWSTKVPG